KINNRDGHLPAVDNAPSRSRSLQLVNVGTAVASGVDVHSIGFSLAGILPDADNALKGTTRHETDDLLNVGLWELGQRGNIGMGQSVCEGKWATARKR